MVLRSLDQFGPPLWDTLEGDDLAEPLDRVDGVGVQLTEGFTRFRSHDVDTLAQEKWTDCDQDQQRRQGRRQFPAEKDQDTDNQTRNENGDESRRHRVREEILHKFHVVGRHRDHIAGPTAHHVGRRQTVELFEKCNPHLRQEPEGHVMRNPGFEPVEDTGYRRHDGQQDEQINERLACLDRPNGERTNCADTDKGDDPGHTKPEGQH